MIRAILATTVVVPLSFTLPAGALQSEATAFTDGTPNLAAGLTAWRADNGPSWQLRRDAGTGHASFLYGSGLAAPVRPSTDADYTALALDYLASAHGLLGIDGAALGDPSVKFLTLGFAGGVDKVVVNFDQVVDGLPVHRGNVNVLMTMNGGLLALDTTGLPGLASFDVVPTRSSIAARAQAVAAFMGTNGVAPLVVSEPRLIVDQESVGKWRQPVTAWEFDLRYEQNGIVLGRRYSVAAEGLGRLVRDEDLIHFIDVGGQVLTNATPGSLPDLGSNPEVTVPAAYMRVESSAGVTTTDVNGFFNYPGVDGPLDVTVQYVGTFNDVFNDQGAEHSVTQSLSGTGNSILMNPTSSGEVTAASNVFTTLNTMRDWIRSINPSDGSMDFVNFSEVNEDFVDFGAFTISSCNAFYNGVSTNYFLPGGGCVNTGYSTVVAHEQGHWLNDRYGSGNGPDGFGEGNADVFAMYLFDTAIVGDGFFGVGSDIRDGNNTLQYCGDGNGGCYGAVHTDGQVHMGVMWKMRRNLKLTHGVALGGLIADGLFSGWMNSFDQSTIDSVIETQILTLDDDDGDISNGTPNYDDINNAFLEQGFPGIELAIISIDNVIAIDSTLDEVGPYGVAIDAASLIGQSIASVRLTIDAGAGAQVIDMFDGGSGTYSALVPGIASPAVAAYFIEVTDSLGNLKSWPDGGAASPATFGVGDFSIYFADDFEGPGDNGWVHAQIATQDDWQRDNPAGKGGVASGISWSDPGTAASGDNVWGNDTGPSGFNGAYQPNVESFLRSPLIDLSGATGATLRFKRWLTVEEAVFDQAQIRLNGAVVWQNPQSGNLVDTAWQDFELDISSVDGDPTVELEFRLITDGGLELGGWNIDQLEISSLAPTPTFCPTNTYGTGLAGQGGLVPSVDSKGQPAQLGNADYLLAIKNGRPNSVGTFVVGLQSTDIPLAGGSLLVVPLLIVDLPLDLFGQAEAAFPLPSTPGLAGSSLFVQAFVADPAAVSGFAMSAGFAVTFCN